MPRPTSHPAEVTTSVNTKSECPFVLEEERAIQMQPAAIASAAAAWRSGRYAPREYSAPPAITVNGTAIACGWTSTAHSSATAKVVSRAASAPSPSRELDRQK